MWRWLLGGVDDAATDSMIFDQSFKQYTNSTGGSGFLHLGQSLVGRLVMDRVSMIFDQSFKQYTNSSGGSGILHLGQSLVGRLVMDRVSMIFGQRFKQYTDATDVLGKDLNNTPMLLMDQVSCIWGRA